MRALTAVFLSALAMPALANDKIAANVDAALARGDRASILVSLASQAKLGPVAQKHKGDERLIASVNLLRSEAERTQAPLRAWLDARKVRYQAFWVANFIALDADADLTEALAKRADVAAIELNGRMTIDRPVAEYPSGPKAITAIEPGVTFAASKCWSPGKTPAMTGITRR